MRTLHGIKVFTAQYADTRVDSVGRPNRRRVHRTGIVELTIDVDALVNLLGKKALWNKTGKARLGSGILQMKVHSVKEEATALNATTMDEPR